MKKQLSMKKLYILAADFVWEKLRKQGNTTNEIDLMLNTYIAKKDIQQLVEFFDYVWKHKNDL